MYQGAVDGRQPEAGPAARCIKVQCPMRQYHREFERRIGEPAKRELVLVSIPHVGQTHVPRGNTAKLNLTLELVEALGADGFRSVVGIPVSVDQD